MIMTRTLRILHSQCYPYLVHVGPEQEGRGGRGRSGLDCGVGQICWGDPGRVASLGPAPRLKMQWPLSPPKAAGMTQRKHWHLVLPREKQVPCPRLQVSAPGPEVSAQLMKWQLPSEV